MIRLLHYISKRKACHLDGLQLVIPDLFCYPRHLEIVFFWWDLYGATTLLAHLFAGLGYIHDHYGCCAASHNGRQNTGPTTADCSTIRTHDQLEKKLRGLVLKRPSWRPHVTGKKKRD